MEAEMEALHKNKTWELIQNHFVRRSRGRVDRIVEDPYE
jgi:hypothetical protein